MSGSQTQEQYQYDCQIYQQKLEQLSEKFQNEVNNFWEAKDAINMEFMQNITAVFKANFEGLGGKIGELGEMTSKRVQLENEAENAKSLTFNVHQVVLENKKVWEHMTNSPND